MPTQLELEISELLSKRGNVRAAGEELISRWRKNMFSPDEQSDCAQFLLASGQIDALLAEIRRLVTESALLPWAQFVEALSLTRIELNKEDLEALREAVEEQEAMGELLRSRALDQLDDIFHLRRMEFESAKMAEIADRRAALHDRLAFVRSQRLLDQELQVLGEFEAMFPDEAEIGNAKQGFDLRWAREVVANVGPTAERAADDRSLKLLEWKADRLTPEQADAKQMIITRAREIAAKASATDPRLAYDIAISLQLMGFHREALDLLDHPDSEMRLDPNNPNEMSLLAAIDWLRLELLLLSRQFATALEEAGRLEVDYSHQPDASFAVIYARARALHGLGQTQPAIELLQTLVRLRPYYKSAQSLIEDWSGDET